jgi:hypothetical protein
VAIDIKIVGYRKAQRYAVRRAIDQALQNLSTQNIDLDVRIMEITEVNEILKFTPVLIYPSLFVRKKQVCTGRIPKQDEVTQWILNELECPE